MIVADKVYSIAKVQECYKAAKYMRRLLELDLKPRYAGKLAFDIFDLNIL